MRVAKQGSQETKADTRTRNGATAAGDRGHPFRELDLALVGELRDQQGERDLVSLLVCTARQDGGSERERQGAHSCRWHLLAELSYCTCRMFIPILRTLRVYVACHGSGIAWRVAFFISNLKLAKTLASPPRANPRACECACVCATVVTATSTSTSTSTSTTMSSLATIVFRDRERDRDEHMCTVMAEYMARMLNARPCMFVRSNKFSSWTGADAPVYDPAQPGCRSCGGATRGRRVLCEVCRRNPVVVHGAVVIDAMFRSSHPDYAMDSTKQQIIILLRTEQDLADESLALAETLAKFAWAVYGQWKRGGVGNVFFSRELVFGGGAYAAYVNCGMRRQVEFGGLGIKMHGEVKQRVVEWLYALDAQIREQFGIPMGHASTPDVSFVTCLENFASLIANRVVHFEDARSDPSQKLCSRGCEHLAQLQHFRCQFYAQNAILADIEGMRALIKVAREGVLPDNPSVLVALLLEPPPELLSLLPSVASDMEFAPLCVALGRSGSLEQIAAWRASVPVESLCMLLERAIASAQAWREPPSGFLQTLRHDATPRKFHLPPMGWVDGNATESWSLLPRLLHAHRRVGLDPTGARIVLMASALMQIDADERFFVPGIVRCDMVQRCAQREMNRASAAHAQLREQLRPFTAGIEWDTSLTELTQWNGSHLESDVRHAAAILGGYSVHELERRFHPGFCDNQCHMLLQRVVDKMVVKPQPGYLTWCELSMTFLIPILRELRSSVGLADNVPTNPAGELLRLLPGVREWAPGSGALKITCRDAWNVPAVREVLLRLETQGTARKKRVATKNVWVIEEHLAAHVLS